MSVDRTQHVIDAIDGALDDWSVGPDAMRWTPEPEAEEPQSRGLTWQPTYVPRHVTIDWRPMSPPRQQDRASLPSPPDPIRFFSGLSASREIAADFRRAFEAVSQLFAVSGTELQQLADAFSALGSLEEESQPEPEDARVRALRLRRERNTGPSRDVVRQRRPRRVP